VGVGAGVYFLNAVEQRFYRVKVRLKLLLLVLQESEQHALCGFYATIVRSEKIRNSALEGVLLLSAEGLDSFDRCFVRNGCKPGIQLRIASQLQGSRLVFHDNSSLRIERDRHGFLLLRVRLIADVSGGLKLDDVASNFPARLLDLRCERLGYCGSAGDAFLLVEK
jgi:hypothetical protein